MPNSNQDHHPVWIVYDKLRTVRLNVKYYSRRLSYIERTNTVIEIITSVPTSAISGFLLWEHGVGKMIWGIFVGIALLIAVIKHTLKLTEKIKAYGIVLSLYDIMEYDLRQIKDLIQQHKKYDEVLQYDFGKIVEREKILVGKSPETRAWKWLKNICEAEVLIEFPTSQFYIPKEEQ